LWPVAEAVAEDKTVANREVRRLEEKIADLKGRWPRHSVPPAMWDELEALETDLDQARRRAGEESHGGQAGCGRLPEV
jgi:hypothetical protein